MWSIGLSGTNDTETAVDANTSPYWADVQRRRRAVAAAFDLHAAQRAAWKRRAAHYHATLSNICRRYVPPQGRVMELGCNTGDLLASLEPSLGVGLDISRRSLAVARSRYPRLHFVEGDAQAVPFDAPWDTIILADTLGYVDDVWQTLRSAHEAAMPDTQVIIINHNFVWRPALAFAEKVGLKMPVGLENWLGTPDIENLLRLTHFEAVERGQAMVSPIRLPLVGAWLDEVADRSLLRHLALVLYWVLRPLPRPQPKPLSCSVIVPCRNEAGNIEACVERVPAMGTHTELIFVDGASTDGTRERIREQMDQHRGHKEIVLIDQLPRNDIAQIDDTQDPLLSASEQIPPDLMLSLGKGDAVRKGFAAAQGDVLMILDADLTVPPEELPKFYLGVAEGIAEFINGSRLVYPLEDEAMHFANLVGNKAFSVIFTWLLGQRIKDTLCGTKVLPKDAYERLAAGRAYFGDFDPFGDFDLLFGAARLGLSLIEVPIRYRRRSYGASKVRVLSHGLLLARMSLIGFRRLKLARWIERLREV